MPSHVLRPGRADVEKHFSRSILHALAEPLAVAGQAISASAGLGISIYPRDGTTADVQLRNADTAM